MKHSNKLNFLILFLNISTFVIILFITLKQKDQLYANKIRTKEIIVQDNKGNDIVILSAEISSTASRLRKDTLSGLLILDKNGQDRVIVGASPSIKTKENTILKRSINGPYGIVYNDENGIEKGGFGYYSDRGLSALGIDGESGEGIVLFVPKKELFGQKIGILINHPQIGGQVMYLGLNSEDKRLFNIDTYNKGRFSFEMDSNSTTKISQYNYIKNKHQTINLFK